MRRGTILFLVVLLLLTLPVIFSWIPTIALIVYEFVAFEFLITLSSFWWILWPIIYLVVLIGIIYFVLAPNNLLFTFVNEGTAKFIVAGRKFAKCLMEWEGYKFYGDPTKGIERWNVVSGRKSRLRRFFAFILGGARFYGLWPLRDVHIYKFKWTGVAEDGTRKPREEWLDYMLLQDDVYYAEVLNAEDKELLPLRIELFLTIRIINPYKARFAIQDWLETIINRMQPLIRGYITTSTYSELSKNIKATGDDMWKELEKAKLVGTIEDPDSGEKTQGEFVQRYGVEVRAIEIRQIEPPEDWRAITLAPYKAEMEAEAIKKIADAQAYKALTTLAAYQEFGLLGMLAKLSEETKGKDPGTGASFIAAALLMSESLLSQRGGVLTRARSLGISELDIEKLKTMPDEDIEKLTEIFRELLSGDFDKISDKLREIMEYVKGKA